VSASGASGSPPAVLYVVSRFPAVTETFVVNEWLALSERFRMRLVALRRSGEAPLHPETARVMPSVRFAGSPLPRAVAANLAWLARRPLTYLALLAAVVRGALRFSLLEAAKEAVVFVRAAAVAHGAARDGIDHVHAHFASHAATAAWVVHRLTGIPFSFTAHANDLFVAPVLLERKAADARFVVAISDYNRRLLLERCPAVRRLEVVHCGVDADRHRPGERDPNRAVCVASLFQKKGHVHLVDAFALIAGRRPGLRLELVGDGPERERILRRARERGVAERVSLLGARSSEEVRATLAGAGVFALPSIRLASGRMEGIPVALMEAMASGVPVVATRLSGIPELVQDGVTGLLVEPGDPEALAAAMERVLDDGPLAAELVANARALVESSFSLTREAQRLGDLFAESISRPEASQRAAGAA
jgi:colanic acid/amylovoran biosynthesis glycosyltransferase